MKPSSSRTIKIEEVPRRFDLYALGITFSRTTMLLRFANGILIITSVLYCLILFSGLSLLFGNTLGGFRHICRASYLSLILLILLLPWQIVFGPKVWGAIYTSKELTTAVSTDTNNMMEKVLFNVRFMGWWILVVTVLALTQLYSFMWISAILRKNSRIVQFIPSKSIPPFALKGRKKTNVITGSAKFPTKAWRLEQVKKKLHQTQSMTDKANKPQPRNEVLKNEEH
jgi:hypothetical protein